MRTPHRLPGTGQILKVGKFANGVRTTLADMGSNQDTVTVEKYRTGKTCRSIGPTARAIITIWWHSSANPDD